MTEKTKEISVEQKLKALYDLQCIMSQIDKIKILRGELPREVQDLEDEIIGLQTRIQNFNKDCESLKLEIGKTSEAIKVSQESVARYKEQMDNVRNNLEYEHLSREVNFEELNIKEVVFVDDLNEYMNLSVKPNFKTVGKVFKREGITSATSVTMEEFMGSQVEMMVQ